MPETANAPAVLHSTFVLERHYAASPERVFVAFSDPTIKRRWYADRGTHTSIEYTMDFRVGGVDRGVYRFGPDTPYPGATFTNITTYQDIIPNQRIIVAYTMSFGDSTPFSASLATFEFAATPDGTQLTFTEQGAFFENSDGPDRRKHGWGKLLDELEAELEAALANAQAS